MTVAGVRLGTGDAVALGKAVGATVSVGGDVGETGIGVSVAGTMAVAVAALVAAGMAVGLAGCKSWVALHASGNSKKDRMINRCSLVFIAFNRFRLSKREERAGSSFNASPE